MANFVDKNWRSCSISLEQDRQLIRYLSLYIFCLSYYIYMPFYASPAFYIFINHTLLLIGCTITYMTSKLSQTQI